MRARAWVCSLGMALVVLGAGGALVACNNSAGARFGNIKSGPMPSGETWAGVYYNPVYGYLHVVEQGGNIVGRWKRTDSSHWGELSGTADGNVLHFAWKEHQYGALGPSSETHGSGVFAYKMGHDNTPELEGKYALEDSDDVGDWHCVKQVGMKVDIDSISGDNPADAPAAQDRWR